MVDLILVVRLILSIKTGPRDRCVGEVRVSGRKSEEEVLLFLRLAD